MVFQLLSQLQIYRVAKKK